MGPPTKAADARYSALAIALHWLIAAAIVFQLVLGWRMGEAEGALRSLILQLHKSVGFSILLLTLARLGWRLAHPPPEPAALGPLERRLSAWVHGGFYAALIALPLTGWAMISTSSGAKTRLFGLIAWPRLPGLSLLPDKIQDLLSDGLGGAHAVLVWAMLALLALHVGGALKHQFILRDPVMARMAPGLRPGVLAQPRLLAIPALIALIALAAFAPTAPPAPPRPKVVKAAAADLYLDVVAPALSRRCGSCHNEDRARGGLSLASYAATLDGGRDGPVIRPGDPARSELLRRIGLPHDHDKFMPKDGKTPLSPDETAAIGWWVAVGAPKTGAAGAFRPTPQMLIALQGALGLGGETALAQAGGEDPLAQLPKAAPADPAVVSRLEADGFVVRKLSRDSNLLVVDFAASRAVTGADLIGLEKISLQMRELNLRGAQLTDAQLKILSPAANLARLRLEGNPITDAGLAALEPLGQLTYLNLVDTRITDSGLDHLSSLPQLSRIYVWGTAVTPAGIARARARPGHPLIFGAGGPNLASDGKPAPRS